MKFIYGYKTSENETREGMLSAASRDAVYRKLRAEGIRPFEVRLAPGFFNHLQALGKRTLVIALLLIVIAVVVINSRQEKVTAGSETKNSSDRHQTYGDPSLMEQMERDGYGAIFAHPGECFLAYYAQPGKAVNIPYEFTRKIEREGALADCLSHEIVFGKNETREVLELKQIVNGIKDELREYLAEGTAAEFVRQLNQRQQEEQQIYNRVRNELEGSDDSRLWEERNHSLRELGLRTIAKPKKDK